MTSEVVLMNRRAAALAADSATTTQYWTGSDWETRYFKGANKIFNLMNGHPVGLMTFDSANVQGAPWEVVAKAYRDDNSSRPRDNLSEYAISLCEYMEENLHLFPMDYQKKQFLDTAETAAVVIMATVLRSPKYPADGKKADRVAAATKEFKHHFKVMQGGPFIGEATAESIKEAIGQHKSDVAEAISKDAFYLENKDLFELEKLAEVGIWGVFNREMPGLDQTGLVVCGFGDKDYFPQALEYNCYGPILGKVYFDTGKAHCVDQENVSEIVPLAQSEMITTFAYGIGRRVRKQIDYEFARAIEAFEDGLRKDGSLKGDTDTIREEVRKQFSDSIVNYMFYSHVTQLRRVVGMLPVSELAELAETLVLIESLKERVTGPSESVSGPIDVAAISKGDGFIWIKRKHYFEPEVNPRYLAKIGD